MQTRSNPTCVLSALLPWAGRHPSPLLVPTPPAAPADAEPGGTDPRTQRAWWCYLGAVCSQGSLRQAWSAPRSLLPVPLPALFSTGSATLCVCVHGDCSPTTNHRGLRPRAKDGWQRGTNSLPARAKTLLNLLSNHFPPRLWGGGASMDRVWILGNTAFPVASAAHPNGYKPSSAAAQGERGGKNDGFSFLRKYQEPMFIVGHCVSETILNYRPSS